MEKTKNKNEKNLFPKSIPNPQTYLEYNFNPNNDLNEAEYKALEQIESSKIRNELRKSKNKEFKKKYNEMTLSYKDEQNKKNQEEELRKKAEYLERIQKMQNFNKTVQEKIMKKKLINNNKNLIWIKKEKNTSKKKPNENNKVINNNPIIVINHDKSANDEVININKMDSNFIAKKTILKSVTTGNNEIENIEIMNDNFIPKKTILKSTNNVNNDISGIEDSKQSELKENENVIDLRTNLEYMINSQYPNNNLLKNNIKESDIITEINERLDNLKRFRYEGIFPEKNQQVQKRQKKKIIKNKIFLSEFEKKRFIKALKHIFTERLGEHNIYIQNICSCGNLQKQLTAIVEKGNLTVYALTEVECANNCVFYQNKKEYMKNINDVLNSIKNIKYENFHNKYKEKI